MPSTLMDALTGGTTFGSAVGDVRARLAKSDRDEDALKPPTLDKMPEAPKPEYTDPMQTFGSTATVLALLGSALTRHPLTTAINSTAEILKGTAQADEEKNQHALKAWQVQTENALKLHQFEQEAYKAAIDKMKADREGARAEIATLAAAFKDDAILGLMKAGRQDDAVALINGRGKLGTRLKTSAGAVKDNQGLQANLQSAEKEYIAAEHAGDPDKLAAARDAYNQARADYADALETGQIRPQKGQTVAGLRKPIGGGGGSLTGDELTEMGQQYLAGDRSVFQNLGRGAQGAENIAKLRGEIARQMAAAGMTGADMAAKLAAFGGETAGLRTIGQAGARIGIGAQELQVALPEALKLSENVWRAGFKPVAQIQQAIEGKSNDPDLLEFQQQNQAVINAYAATMTRGGASTVSAGQRASELLSSTTSQAAYARQLDRLNKEVEQMQFGTDEAKQQILDQISGRHTELPKPELTGVPREAPTKPKADDATLLEGARKAIAAGADREAVISRLKAWNVDTGGL
jgi:hypothetical protein